ncbi:hypothetical protein U0035_06395 [Niabella yanshanensis]|uniref:DUF4198 domain-containing protein n=1 Tax=Niabella yanshanensis TaxID=577386 RepID=A0ABZ0WCA6_9BACT|nr:hypothetical protein [Niabella yanshanensis]WQD39775.1 hypothetical protein U0035_06395 [Niabella yanshanensis]
MKYILTFIFSLTTIIIYCQMDNSKIIGNYVSDMTRLELKADGTFSLSAPDYVFPYTFKNYETSGKWVSSGKEVILNPDKVPRTPVLTLTEKKIDNADSIEIKIIYQTREYENEVEVGTEHFKFDLMTLYLNKAKNYIHLVHAPKNRNCTFARKVKRQHILDSSSTVRFPVQNIEKIGIYTYGFKTKKELIPRDPHSSYFEIIIVQPVDKERTPRSKKVIIKGKHAFFMKYTERF